VTGLTTAYYLNKKGYRVSVVEQEKSCGLRNSFGCPTPFTGEYKTNLDKTERKALFNAIVKKSDPQHLRTGIFIYFFQRYFST
jgi:glycine/D-amino acid oxidase-like deaminating enzyme